MDLHVAFFIALSGTPERIIMKLGLIGNPLGHSWSPEIHKILKGIEDYKLWQLEADAFVFIPPLSSPRRSFSISDLISSVSSPRLRR